MGKSVSRIKKTLSALGEDLPPSGPRIEIFSNKEATVEGCRGILEYSDSYIKLNIGCGSVCFIGIGLYAHSYNGESVVLKGKINSIEYCVG